MVTFLTIAFLFWAGRKAWKWVQLRCAQADFEIAFLAGLREDIRTGKIKWPRS